MPLTSMDWAVIIGYLLVNLLIGIYYRRRASGNTEEFFVSGRDVSWWLAGTSMVATTFAADTPLFVCGVVAKQGIAGNWIWWAFCVGGMMTVFFFARYWRRAEILTDVQFVEIRYGGKPAAFLRGFKAIYLGLFMNCVILGWVTKAMVSIIAVLLGPVIAQGRILQFEIFGHTYQHVLGDPQTTALAICIFVLIPFTGPGVQFRPIRQMSGAAEFAEDFLDGVRAPLFNVIGGLNNGWRVAMTTLGHERGGRATTAYLRYEREFWDLAETARKHGKVSDPLVRQDLARAWTGVQLMRFTGLRELAQVAEGRPPGPEASVSKLFWSEYHKRLGEIALGITGADGLIRPDGDGYPVTEWQNVFLSSRAGTIYSGTSEIQRTIIGERALGLPKEPRAPGQDKAQSGARS